MPSIGVTETKSSGWKVSASTRSLKTMNLIREVVGKIGVKPNPEKPEILLALGDPTVFGNLDTCEEVVESVVSTIQAGKSNGYADECGILEARKALADYYTTENSPLTADDIVLASGCSHALQMVIGAIADEGQNILVPHPGFSLYETLSHNMGIQTKAYNLLADKNWECDLAHMESLIDEKTVAILINNPSNPCGSVFSREHTLAIIELAKRNHLPIVSDEIYREMCFEGFEFNSFAENTTEVPVIAVSGLAKRFLVPGWRLGWIFVHDRNNILTDGRVREGIQRMATLIVGPNKCIQAALPSILKKTPQNFFDDTLKTLQDQARYCKARVDKIPCLDSAIPQGAMYMMIKMNLDMLDIKDDMDFVRKLRSEESVFVLPGLCFNITGFFRIVICPSKEMLAVAFDRLQEFCDRHMLKTNGNKVV